jgi:hypothetical protein
MKQKIFEEIEVISQKSKVLFNIHYPNVKEDEITQEIVLWSDNDYSLITFSSFGKDEEWFREEIYFHNKEGFSKCLIKLDDMTRVKEEPIIIKEKKKVILVGASIPNLFGARELKRKGFDVIIYERNNNYNNPQQRRLSNKFLDELGFSVELNENGDYLNSTSYVKLNDLKDFLRDDTIIICGGNLKINLDEDKVLFGAEYLDFDYLIYNTGHNKIEHNSKKIFTYDYSLGKVDNHFAGNSLITSVEKIKKIIVNIELDNHNFEPK